MTISKVTILGTKDLAIFIAQLVREGVTFECYHKENGGSYYVVELTGGY